MAPSLFRKHESQLTSAWKKVLDDKDPIDWMLIGYDGQSDTMKLYGTGEYGLDELYTEFNPGQVMYAFCSVLHPRTKLKTFLIINWVGEGAPIHRKATSASHHQSDVKNFFKYSSLTIHARVEEDVEPDAILEHLAKVATTEYDFSAKDRFDSREDDQITPVGTCYERVKAEREINLKEKTLFWSQMQQEEVQRKQEDRKRLQQECQEAELERVEREKRTAAVREDLIRLKEKQLEQQRQTEVAAENLKKKQELLRSNLVQDQQQQLQPVTRQAVKRKVDVSIQERESFWAKQEEEERQRRAEEQRQKEEQRRNLEQELQNRENSAKTLKQSFDGWNHNSTSKVVKKTDAFAEIDESRRRMLSQENKENVTVESSIDSDLSSNEIPDEHRVEEEKETNGKINKNESIDHKEYQNGHYHNGASHSIKLKNVTQTIKKNVEENRDEEENDESTLVMNRTFDVSDPNHESNLDDISNSVITSQQDADDFDSPDEQRDLYMEELMQPRRSCLEVIAEEEEESHEDNFKVLLAGKGQCAKAVYEYVAADDQEISFDPDDIITHIKQTFETWWEGLAPDEATYGLFPANYVELIN